MDALRRRNVPVERQVAVPVGGSRELHIDLGVAAVRWGIELDLHPEHRTYDGSANDARRYRDLHLRSWQIEPVTEPDMDDVEALAEHLATLYHARCDDVADHPMVW